MSRSPSNVLPPRGALSRSSSNSDAKTPEATPVDIDTLMLTINNAVAKIASIRESFEDGRPPRHSSASSSRRAGKTRLQASSATSSTFDDSILRFSSAGSYQDSFRSSGRSQSGGADYGDGKPPLPSSRSLASSFTSSTASSPSVIDRRSSKTHAHTFPDDEGGDDDVVAPDLPPSRTTTTKAKLPFPYHKLQSTTSIDLDDNLTPFKELRLARLQDIKVTFHNGLPQEFYQAICRFLQTTLEIKRRFYKLKHLKECFLGCDAFDALLDNGFATDENEALLIGNVLLKLELVEDITGPSARMKNRNDGFYRFTLAGTSMEKPAADAEHPRGSLMSLDGIDFADASDNIHALLSEESLAIVTRVLARMFDKKGKIMPYKGYEGCFLGSELVTALKEMKIAMSTIDALVVGQSLFEEQLILAIDPDTTDFQSKYTMYRLPHL
ncbi:hypothetical protein DYB34_007954 [Aphanomyces astaci]|uniref:DEP domain-containing protein n=1 Tax=Aphanomyces astaci TaxID=112090 RepID=A0A3R6Z119_APHAT|nr:hypothetical protein DYB34_007954 [Aphanomyces astaci]